MFQCLDCDPYLPSSFLSFVPSVVFVLFALLRLVHFLPRKQRRLLPLSELSAGGVILLLTRIALSACLVGANIAVWVTWEKSDGLKGDWSGWTAAAFDAVAAVRPSSAESLLIASASSPF